MKYHSQHISSHASELLLTWLLDADAEEDTPDKKCNRFLVFTIRRTLDEFNVGLLLVVNTI